MRPRRALGFDLVSSCSCNTKQASMQVPDQLGMFSGAVQKGIHPKASASLANLAWLVHVLYWGHLDLNHKKCTIPWQLHSLIPSLNHLIFSQSMHAPFYFIFPKVLCLALVELLDRIQCKTNCWICIEMHIEHRTIMYVHVTWTRKVSKAALHMYFNIDDMI